MVSKRLAAATIVILIIVVASFAVYFSRVLSNAPKTSLTIALDWTIYGKYAMFYPAQKFGWYEDAGISVQWLPGRGSADNVKRLLSGEVDIAIVSGITVIIAKSIGVDLVCLGSYHDLNPVGIFSRKGSGITTLNDLSGKTVFVAIGGDESRMVPLALTLNDVSDVNIIEADFGTKVGGFINGDVEIISSYTTVLAGIWHQGIETEDIFLYDYGIDIVSNIFACTAEFLEENEDLVRNFIEVTYNGIDYAIQNKDAAVNFFMELNPDWEDRGLAAAQFDVAIDLISSPEALQYGYGYMDLARWQRTNVFCTQSRVVDAALSDTELLEVYTNAYLP